MTNDQSSSVGCGLLCARLRCWGVIIYDCPRDMARTQASLEPRWGKEVSETAGGNGDWIEDKKYPTNRRDIV